MPSRKQRKQRKRPLRPRTPSRVKKRSKRRRQSAGHQHPELIGLGLAAFGLFLASLLLLGWEGGIVGEKIEQALREVVGSAAYAVPVALTVVGALMLFRSALVEVRPFRTGLVLATAGLMITLGSEHGGRVGTLLGGGLAKLLGSTGALIVGATALVAGGLLLTGASAGAILRRSGGAVRRASSAARRRAERPGRTEELVLKQHKPLAPPRHEPPVDVVHDYPDVVSEGFSEPPRLLIEPDEDTQSALFELPREQGEYVLPDRSVLKSSPPQNGNASQASAQTAETLLQALAHFGIDATIVGQIAGPRVTRYELQLAPGTKVSKVAALKDDLSYALATTEIRILAPIPGKQAVGVEVPAVSPRIVTLGDIYDDLPATASPLAVWLGKDISGDAGLGRPRSHAAHPHRRHDRLGQVGLHQHDPDVDPPPLHAGRGAADPDRPEADRAELLRVDPAPADAGRLEPQGGERRPHERRRGDGARATSASRSCARATCRRRTGPSGRAGRSRCRTCSS